MRQQNSVSSFNHNLEESKTEDSHRYFVNALGQRISSTVLEMHPEDLSLQRLFNGMKKKEGQEEVFSEETKY